MQSGTARTKEWVLSYEPEAAKTTDPLMGWTGSADMQQQIHLSFDSRDDAVAYAERNGIPFEVREPKTRRRNIQAYADNFK